MTADTQSKIYFELDRAKRQVLMFGKSPELTHADAVNGDARFGGGWRHPSYLMAYAHAAGILVTQGQTTGTLDAIALPAFYMQRHALELLVKRFLGLVYDYAKAVGRADIFSKDQSTRLRNSHDLTCLLSDLTRACQQLELAPPPEELSDLIATMMKFEPTKTWARYPYSQSKAGLQNHTQDETVLPIVALQKKLEDVLKHVVFTLEEHEAYESLLFEAWADATRAHGPDFIG
jgi:hypothetical protein